MGSKAREGAEAMSLAFDGIVGFPACGCQKGVVYDIYTIVLKLCQSVEVAVLGNLQALVHDILPSTTAVFSYVIKVQKTVS